MHVNSAGISSGRAHTVPEFHSVWRQADDGCTPGARLKRSVTRKYMVCDFHASASAADAACRQTSSSTHTAVHDRTKAISSRYACTEVLSMKPVQPAARDHTQSDHGNTTANAPTVGPNSLFAVRNHFNTRTVQYSSAHSHHIERIQDACTRFGRRLNRHYTVQYE